MSESDAFVQHALQAEEAGRVEEAQLLYEQQLAADPEDLFAQFCYVRVLYEQDKYSEVIDAALPLVERWRREHKGLLLCIIGNCYKHLGEYGKAEQYLRRSLAEKPEPWAWVYLHSALYRLNRDDEAIECLRAAIEIDPDYEEAHFSLGGHYNSRKQYDLAEYHLRKAIEIDTKYAKAYAELGSVLYSRNLDRRVTKVTAYSEAKRMLRKSIRLDASSVWPHLTLGAMLSYLEENDAAEREYQRVLELWPDCSAGLWLYAELLSSTGIDRAKARRLLNRALEVDPKDATAYFYLGLHLLRLHRKSKARNALSKAADLGHAKAQELLSEL